RVLAVIRGSALNQDGRSNGITAPNRLAQEDVIRQALANAGLEPQHVSYVEAHGSATRLGDPIEVEALLATLGQARTSEHPLVIGSVKTNIGHLAGAAGIAGLIKTVLALHHREIPPHLHLETRNPYIPWRDCPIVIPEKCLPWPAEKGPRIAGVSSFGWSGTNVHVLREESQQASSCEPSRREQFLLLLSAKTEMSLERATGNLLSYLKQNPAVNLADVAYTYQTGRNAFAYRKMLVCKDVESVVSLLERGDSEKMLKNTCRQDRRPVTFLFPGTWDLFTSTTEQLLRQEPAFRAWVDTCCNLLQPLLGFDLREFIFPSYRSGNGHSHATLEETRDLALTADHGQSNGSHAGKQIGNLPASGENSSAILWQAPDANSGSNWHGQTVQAQCASFVTSYALARLLISWGI